MARMPAKTMELSSRDGMAVLHDEAVTILGGISRDRLSKSGDYTQNPFSRHFECNGDVSPAITFGGSQRSPSPLSLFGLDRNGSRKKLAFQMMTATTKAMGIPATTAACL